MKRLLKFGIRFSYWFIYFFITIILFSLLLSNISNPSNPSGDTIRFLKTEFWFINVSSSMLGFYSFYFFIFKAINTKIHYFKIIIKGLFYCISIGILTSTINLGILKYYGSYVNPSIEIKFEIFFTILIFSALLSLLHGILGLFMRLFFDWFIINKEKEALTEQNHQIEMELVKAQLNPHFLFNSLNNIDVLIHKDQEKASDFLNRLSDIMRYMLFDAKTEKVRFETEFHFIEKYVSLHQLRASNSDYVTIQNKVANTDGFIASLVFIPFIENAFKYASSFKIGNAIQIEFIEEQHTLRFICKNRIATESGDLISSNGLGNQLLKKRLDLIYKETYTLNIQEENEYFCVDLTIPYEAN